MTDMTSAQISHGRVTAIGAMVLGSIAISFNGLILRFMQDADAWQIAFWRSVGVVGMVALILLWRYGRKAPAKVIAVGRGGLLGGILMAGASITFLQSITTTTVANTLFMLSAIPFITAIMALIFLGERLKRATLLTMMGAFGGVGVMVAGSIGGGVLYGNLMGLCTALCFSGYAIIVRRDRDIEMLPTLLIAGVVVGCISAALRWHDLIVPMGDIGRALFLGGVLSAFANVIFIAASKHLVAAEVTLFMLLEFALGPIWVWLIIAETPARSTIIGGSIVILAVALRALNEIRQSRARRPHVSIRPH